MASYRCTSCGLIHQPGQCRRRGPEDITPAHCCATYLGCLGFLFLIFLFALGMTAMFIDEDSCYLELFTDSVSVSNANVNANVSTADWRIGDEVLSKYSSPSWDGAGDKTNVVFEKVVMPEVIGDVIWNLRVEIMCSVKTDANFRNRFLIATCPDIPVELTKDPAGNVVGSLLGNMRRLA
ncbi:hypothetical protein ISN44_As05g020490 [Arabidopsis suecica]|uniref:Transmembrane protein n=1 Tax=Arabidopsis suecica TaxID=45249 RepID=A0A8T2DI98_ARASU|nr:hypothetical protein ISN44_As05g020490 [Arabidopsis suecica]